MPDIGHGLEGGHFPGIGSGLWLASLLKLFIATGAKDELLAILPVRIAGLDRVVTHCAVLVIPHAFDDVVLLFQELRWIEFSPHSMPVDWCFHHHRRCAYERPRGEIALGRGAEGIAPLLLFVLFVGRTRGHLDLANAPDQPTPGG